MSEPPARLATALADRYAIERELGAGGMATVYLAQDLRHDRQVAVKVLKPELAAVIGAERFLQEIKVTAHLQHPHILPLFDSGETDGFLFYVMPYIEGESLRDRLSREKQLPVDEAVEITRAVASALDYAHRHKVIHRDIKPENILLHDGQPVVADFGIALAVSVAGGHRITETGLSLGTPQYMSPEQATADRELDGRTDIYSLGCVLYEMLAGDPPHTGTTVQAVIAKVLTDVPRSVRLSRPAVPAHVEAAVHRALEKLPADRLATATQFAEALEGRMLAVPRAGATAPVLQAGAGPARSPLQRFLTNPQITAGLALLAALGAAGTVRFGLLALNDPVRTTVRFQLVFDEDQPWVDASGTPFALSPDGRLLAFVGNTGRGPRRLYVRPLADLRARELAGSDGATQPFFSPDGEWIGFESGGQLKKVPVSGGAPVLLAEVPTFQGASWSTSGEIVVATEGRLAVIPAAGGAPRTIATPDDARGETSQRWPLMLPDGEAVLYTTWPSEGLRSARIAVASLRGGEPRALDLVGTAALAVIEDLLIYASASGAIMAVRFDAGAQRHTGTPAPVVDGVTVGLGGPLKGSVSPAGSAIYVAGNTSAMNQLILAAPGSSGQPLIPEARPYAFPRYSPDGKHVAFALGGERTDVWILDLPSGPVRRLTAEGTLNDRPEWTPDSRHVLFRSNRGGRQAFWIQPADGSRVAELFFKIDSGAVDEAMLSSDSAYLILQIDTTRCNCVGTSYYRRTRGDTTLVSIAATGRGQHTTARISPNGRWVAYRSNEMGTLEVYVKPFPALDARYQISLAGGEQPVWSRDGRRLYYLSGNRLLSATLAFSPSFAVVARDTVLDNVVGNPLPPTSANHANFDVAPDGRSLLFLRGGTSEAKVIVVYDWKHELRERLRPSTP